MEYIAGRPFAVNGGNVEPGDRMTKEQMDSIPYVESFISSGYIYPVYTDKDYDRLPPHLFTMVMERREMEAAMAQRTAMVPENAAAAQELGDQDDSRILAAKEAKIDAKNLAKNFVRQVNPAEVKTEDETTPVPVEEPQAEEK